MSIMCATGQSLDQDPVREMVEYVLREMAEKAQIMSFNSNPKLAMPLAMAPNDGIYDIKVANRKHYTLAVFKTQEKLDQFMSFCKKIGEFVIPYLVRKTSELRHRLPVLLLGGTRRAKIRLSRFIRDQRRQSVQERRVRHESWRRQVFRPRPCYSY